MGSSIKAGLLKAAELRSKMVIVESEEVHVREVGALAFAEYGKELKTDRLKATASIIASCVIDEDGGQLLTAEEAMTIASSARVSMPIVNAIMELSGFGDDAEKEPDAS